MFHDISGENKSITMLHADQDERFRCSEAGRPPSPRPLSVELQSQYGPLNQKSRDLRDFLM